MDTGREHVRKHEWTEAAASFAQVLDKLTPGFRGASQEMRFCIEMVQRPEVFDKLVKLRSNNRLLWLVHGRSYAASGEWTKAARDYKKGLELSSAALSETDADHGPWIGWGVANFELGALLLLAGDEA